jgi:hypothetical protein
MSRFAHFALSAVALAFRPSLSSQEPDRKGISVDYEKPEVESQVDVTGIMGWGGLPNKDPYH